MVKPIPLRPGVLILVLVLCLSLWGCGGSEPESSMEESAGTTAPVDGSLPALADLAEGWNRLEPGGETTCSDGSDYSFFVRRADPSKLLVYLQGGGGCWTGDTCSSDRVGSFRPVVGDTDPARADGIFALENAENPFADYSMVFVPYCTGDVHLGDNVETYEVAAVPAGTELEEGKNPEAHSVSVRHRGHANAMAVLDWTYDQFEAPETVFVTGSSAGSIPSPYYGAHLATQYPDAHLAVLGDGAGGYRRFDSALQPFEPWGTLDAIDAHAAFTALQPEEFTYESLYVVAAQQRPDLVFAQYDTAEDEVQLRFISLGGNAADSLQPFLDANHDDIAAEVDNFRYFVAGGDLHTVLGRPEFYSYRSDGVRVRDWVAALAAGEPVDNVHCGERCAEPDVMPSADGASTGGG